MKIENQVLSIEQMKHLQELGVDTSDASMVWIKQDSTLLPDNIKELWLVDTYHDSLKPMVEQEDSDFVQTYTIGDLIEKLPKHINGWNDNRLVIDGDEDADYWYVVYKNRYEDSETEYFDSENLLTALYNLLCWVAENHKELLEVKND